MTSVISEVAELADALVSPSLMLFSILIVLINQSQIIPAGIVWFGGLLYGKLRSIEEAIKDNRMSICKTQDSVK